MKTFPLACSFALTAMLAAGLAHHWSTREFLAAIAAQPTLVATPAQPAATPLPVVQPAPANPKLASQPADPTPAAKLAATPALDSTQKQFFETLINKIDSLQTQNRDLLDQLAETNRDLMKLEFRVDTHSESFRPLPVSQDHPFTTLNTESESVLPPRAKPVTLPIE